MNESEDKVESDELKDTARQFKRSADQTDPASQIVLPPLMLVTHSPAMKPDFSAALKAALRGGARLIQLRETPNVTRGSALREYGNLTRELCKQFEARWVFNGHDAVARSLGADGVHQPERSIWKRPRDAHFLRGASVHSLQAAQRAIDANADYLVFGSIWETASHPDGTPAGLEMLREVCELSPIPVYAIGGVTAKRVALCRQAGAHGVAVMRAVWDAPDVAEATRELVAQCDVFQR